MRSTGKLRVDSDERSEIPDYLAALAGKWFKTICGETLLIRLTMCMPAIEPARGNLPGHRMPA